MKKGPRDAWDHFVRNVSSANNGTVAFVARIASGITLGIALEFNQSDSIPGGSFTRLRESRSSSCACSFWSASLAHSRFNR